LSEIAIDTTSPGSAGATYKLVDTHAHIYSDEFKSDLDEVIERTLRFGIDKIYMPNIDASSIEAMLEVEQKYPGICIPMMGLHPCYVTKDFEKDLAIIEGWLAKRPFAAIGEIGTDLYWDKTTLPLQTTAFEIQLGWAKKYRLPVVIHCRDSFRETADLIARHQDGSLRGVFHCFGGTVEDAREAIDLGFLLGIGGVCTFKNGGLDKVLPHIDMKHLVLETDSPYLAPVPFRGKRNETSYLELIARRVAEIKGLTFEEIATATSLNANNLFETKGNMAEKSIIL
jgi:TatD DNase family protein